MTLNSFFKVRNLLQIPKNSSSFVSFSKQNISKRLYWNYVGNTSPKHAILHYNHTSLLKNKQCIRQLALGPIRESYKKWIAATYHKFDKWLEKISPSGKKLLDTFTIGGISTLSYIKTYYYVSQRLKVNPNAAVSYDEAMKMYMIKKDAIKVAPLAPLCLVPFGFVILVLPAYLFPRLILPHAFWTDVQRQTFYKQYHKRRMQPYNIILHHMNYHKEISPDSTFRHALENISNVIQAKNIPSNHMLLKLKPFCSQIENPMNIETRQVFLLLQSFSRVILANSILPPSYLSSQLRNYGLLILQLDEKLRSENLLRHLSTKEIETATLMRGLDSCNLSSAANVYWLKNWLELTKMCKANDYWFALHAMVLLSINYTEVKFQRKAFD